MFCKQHTVHVANDNQYLKKAKIKIVMSQRSGADCMSLFILHGKGLCPFSMNDLDFAYHRVRAFDWPNLTCHVISLMLCKTCGSKYGKKGSGLSTEIKVHF